MPHLLPLFADVSTPGQQEDLAEDQDPESPGRFKRWEEKGLLLTRTALDNARKLIPPEQQEDLAKDQDADSPSRFKRWEGRTAQKALDTAKIWLPLCWPRQIRNKSRNLYYISLNCCPLETRRSWKGLFIVWLIFLI